MPLSVTFPRALGDEVPPATEPDAVRFDAPEPVPAGAPSTDAFYRDLILSMRNGVIAVERDGGVVVINDVACRILGVARELAQPGRHFRDVLGPGHEFTQVLSAAFDLTLLPGRCEIRLRQTGKVVGFTVSRIVDRGGAITGAVIFFKDLTLVEQVEERERLRDRLAALGEMAAAIAHEVKNPLAGIQVMAGLVKRRLPETDADRSVLNDIINEARIANKIVVDLLEYVRPIALQLGPVSIPDVIRDAVSKSEGQIPADGVMVEARLPEDLPSVPGDATQLRQVFTNLLVNALEALDGYGRVAISTELLAGDVEETPTGDDWVVVNVDDDGPGIPDDVSERIFGPFFTTKPRGSGLGLAIVRRIIDAHDGHIDVSARPEGGTRFQITLPVRHRREPLGTTPDDTGIDDAPDRSLGALG